VAPTSIGSEVICRHKSIIIIITPVSQKAAFPTEEAVNGICTSWIRFKKVPGFSVDYLKEDMKSSI
jgi:hypothetical protein